MTRLNRLRQSLVNADGSLREKVGERGIALIMTLWIIVLLTLIASEFSFNMRTEIKIATNYKERTTAYYYALAGFNAALSEIVDKHEYGFTDSNGDFVFTNQRPLAEEDALPPTPDRAMAFQHGGFRYFIRAEADRFDLNQITNPRNIAIFEQLLEYAGLDDEYRTRLKNAVLDWVDDNDEEKIPGGAESDWYEQNYEDQGFNEPYFAKNDIFDSVGELLMVRGFNEAILYGGTLTEAQAGEAGASMFSFSSEESRSMRGIADFLTVHSGQAQVSLFSASEQLIRAIYLNDDNNYDRAMEERAKGPFRGDTNFGRKFFLPPNQMATYRIVSTGYVGAGVPNHTIVAVVHKPYQNDRMPTKILLWIDDAPLPQRFGGTGDDDMTVDKGPSGSMF